MSEPRCADCGSDLNRGGECWDCSYGKACQECGARGGHWDACPLAPASPQTEESVEFP